MTKYFSYDALDGELYFHNSEQEAKDFALKIAEDSCDENQEWDGSIPEETQEDIKRICYGEIFGEVDLPTRPSSIDEDGEDVAGEFKSILQPPVIVEREQRSYGWIKCSERLPPNHIEVLCCNHLTIAIATRVNDSWFASINAYPMFVTHWQPLPQLPIK
nr:MAG TPA: Protein of unknown function (DUF551) [Caudoviricetes sp.]